MLCRRSDTPAEYSSKPPRIPVERCRLCHGPSKLRMPTRAFCSPHSLREARVTNGRLRLFLLRPSLPIFVKKFPSSFDEMRHNNCQNQCFFRNLRSRVKTLRCAIRLSQYIGGIVYTRQSLLCLISALPRPTKPSQKSPILDIFSFPITGAYRKRPRRSVANGADLVFPDNRNLLVYRKYIC